MPIREATIKEAPTVLAFIQEFFPYKHMDLPTLEQRMQDLNIAILVYEEGKTIHGFVDIEIITPSAGEVRLNGVAVRKESQYHGIGGQLVKAAIAWSEERGMTRMVLLVEPTNAPAKQLYTILGFVFEKEAPPIEGKPVEQWAKKLHPPKPEYVH
ncbi:MAG: GNAT family N-acetyltransferase [Candidatus Diapherotrites archaeon]|nr:GNAT family N-acetyltransferase [Candidatus Diapherotrites archaeon]MDZ4256904.1 GNAT family N-acetyltransferase [archaeon]